MARQLTAVQVVQHLCFKQNFFKPFPDPVYQQNPLSQPILKATVKFFVTEGKFSYLKNSYSG